MLEDLSSNTFFFDSYVNEKIEQYFVPLLEKSMKISE